MKRAFDVCVAAAALVVLSPVLVVIAAAIKLRSTGPVLYFGSRVGRNGVPFRMCKFRTMVVNADKIGGPSTSDDDARMTPIGSLMRRYKLDELPQLWNVLVGEMSLVGPRPEVRQEVDKYTPEERQLLTVRPGITDYASIRFHNEGEILRGSADPHEAYLRLIRPEKVRLGLEYVRTASFGGDLKIIALTVSRILGVDADRSHPTGSASR